MKKILISITIILMIGTTYSKTRSQTTTTINIISLSEFDLILNGAAIAGSNTALLDSTHFLQKFGHPISTSYAQSELDDQLVSHYAYTGADIWFMSNKLLAMNITSSNYVFKLTDGSATIKVGDPVTAVTNLFPESGALMSSSKIFIGLKNSANQTVDTNLIFEFDSSGKISSIAIQ